MRLEPLRQSLRQIQKRQTVFSGVTELNHLIPARWLSLLQSTEKPTVPPHTRASTITTTATPTTSSEETHAEFTSSDAHVRVASLLHVALPPEGYFLAAPGHLIGRSSQVKVELTAPVVWPAAIGRGLFGGHALLERVQAKEKAGDCFLSSPTLGDLALLELDGETTYHIRPRTFTASSATISTQMSSHGLGMMAGGLYAYQITGKGTLVLHAYGGIYRITLAQGETYHFDPKHLIAWDTRIRPGPKGPESQTPAPPKNDAVWRRYAVATVHLLNRQAHWLWRRVMGSRDLYEVQGPGDLFLQSRPTSEPRLRLRRPINPSDTTLPPVQSVYTPTIRESLSKASKESYRIGSHVFAQTASGLGTLRKRALDAMAARKAEEGEKKT